MFVAILAAAQHAEPSADLPDLARAMLEAAARTNETAQIYAVANAAKEVFPAHAHAIDGHAARLKQEVVARLLAASDEVVVEAAPPEEKEPPKLPMAVDAIELQPGEAPKWLKLGDWDGKATASGLLSTGNSRNAAGGLAIETRREVGPLTHQINTYFDYGKSKGVKSQQRWGLAYKLDARLGDSTYAYGRFSYDEDEFSGFDYKLFGGVGIGHRFFESKELALKVEGGPGYQYAPIDDTRAIDKEAAFYASGEFDWIIREGVKIEQDLNATWTESTSTVISKTALTTALTDTLSTGLSYFVRYETNPPAGRVNTDTTFRMNLTYGF